MAMMINSARTNTGRMGGVNQTTVNVFFPLPNDDQLKNKNQDCELIHDQHETSQKNPDLFLNANIEFL